MQRKAEKILVFILVGFLIITSTSNIPNHDVQKDAFESPKISPVFSTRLIRPNDDYVNPHWDSDPISDKINDSIVYPTAGGDSDFVVGNALIVHVKSEGIIMKYRSNLYLLRWAGLPR